MSFEGPSISRMSSSESGSSSPLRKKTALAQANTRDLNETVLNDDEAERRERRRKSAAPDPASSDPPDDPNKRKSLGLGACSGLSSAQLSEHFANCIKLSTENKITVKNAFSLQLIDYMSMMLKRHDKQMDDFQVASCTLDASTKIYSFRVDAVHSDVVQMATSMGRTEAARKKNAAADDGEQGNHAQDDDDEADPDGPPESQVLKKIRKKARKVKSSITDKPETLLRKQQVFQTMSPFLVRLSANLAVSQSGDCPFHHSLKYREDTKDDTESNTEIKSFREAQIARGVVSLPSFGDIEGLEICPSFRNFTFVGWKPEKDPSPADVSSAAPSQPPLLNVNEDHAFDMNLTPEPIPEFNDADAGGLDDGVDSENEELYAGPESAARAAAKLKRKSANIVDLRQHLSTVPLEYSYFQQSALSLWAGPTHWKVKPLKKDKVHGHGPIETRKRSKKELVLNFQNSSEMQKGFGSAMKKLNKKTIQGWSTDRVTMPSDIHYDPINILRLFLRQSITVKVSDSSNPPEVDDGVGNYAYDNPTDQTSFCPNVPSNEDVEVDIDGDDDIGADIGGEMPPDDDMFPNQDVHTDMEIQEEEMGAFTGDNLIAPPSKVARVYIPYQMRAKKMDMKKLKQAMWEVLTDAPDSDKENQTDSNLQEEADDAEKRTVEGTVHFKDLYKALPDKLTTKMTENLSCALAFVGLLHLANEKNLDIKGVDEMNDLIIKQG